MAKPASPILLLIVFSQFCCTSLWFASNGVMEALTQSFDLESGAMGHLTSAVQFGFIFGTLIFALLNIADRFTPSKVFFFSALIGALFNAALVFSQNTMFSLILLRFFCGFFLAGIYPVGMKIAADHFQEGLGKSLSYLVGALVLGTAFPHLLNSFNFNFNWQTLILMVSGIALVGGLLMLLFVPNGPFRKQNLNLDLRGVFKVFKSAEFRSASMGYLGHMWELYAFWAFVPLILKSYADEYPNLTFNLSLTAFLIIAIGSVGCVIGGYISRKHGLRKTAKYALIISGGCCLLSPFLFSIGSFPLFLLILFIWGMAVIADSPLLSTLVAQNAEPTLKGTALTIVNSIGFAVTIISIQLLSYLSQTINDKWIYVFLALGPIFGWLALIKKKKLNQSRE